MTSKAAETRSLWRRFGGLIAVVGIVGIVLALSSDRPSIGEGDGYWAALREIGGAVVAGAILAGLVVWFEDRRESERVDREEERDEARFKVEQAREDAAARSAWQREIDVRLVAAITVDLASARLERLEWFEEDTKTRDISALGQLVPQVHTGKSFGAAYSDVESLLRFRRDQHLTSAWEEWGAVDDLLARVPPPRSTSAPPNLFSQINLQLPPDRDPARHSTVAAAEERAWDGLVSTLDSHIEMHYPVDNSEVTGNDEEE